MAGHCTCTGAYGDRALLFKSLCDIGLENETAASSDSASAAKVKWVGAMSTTWKKIDRMRNGRGFWTYFNKPQLHLFLGSGLILYMSQSK